MLEKSSLLNYARQRDMPATKMRGIIREYLHVLMLKQIYHSEYSEDYFFTGGTSLRLIDGIKRFSEDLDFYSLISTEDEFEALVDDIMKGTRQYGIEGQYTIYKRGTLLTADINFRDIEKHYGIEMRKKSGLMIKVESAVPG
ncbi:MAG: nucleotidyl transferase AbiEii/AbiGii toxin family protein, partial [candidate division WOR-3 bacterium]|nr:nucleotidyl transferase AbiEii/AbiGii toxin family protein [candidate division WOR-3 bacterium]